MGHDQGNVPITVLVAPQGSIISRTCIVGFAFFIFSHTATTQPSLRNRCGFVDRTTTDHMAKLAEGIQALVRPSLPVATESSSGRFRIHYATSGSDAVSPIDVDGNSVPDYVDDAIESLEHAWRTEVDTLGYLPPPSDGLDGGTAAMDVYVRDLSKAGPSGTSYYGVTTLDRLISTSPADRYTTWMEVDNNFAETDLDTFGDPAFSTFGIDALNVTCAHEFHHTIQNGSYGLSGTQLMMYELTSTWMEMRVWPEVRDWAVYVNAFMYNPERWPFSETVAANGYVWSWYGNVLAEVAPNMLRSVWQKIAVKTQPFPALIEACSENGTSFSEVFCQRLNALFQTGTRGSANAYIPKADSIDEIRLYTDEQAIAPSMVSSGNLRPFEVRAIRYSVPSSVQGNSPVSVAVLITWPDETALANGSTQSLQSYTVTITASPLPTDAVIPGTTWGMRVSPSTLCFFLVGAQTRKPASPFPQPISLSATRRLFVPIEGGIPGQKVSLTLLTASTIGIYTSEESVELSGDLIVAPFDLPIDLAPGTYLVSVETVSTRSLLKIAVQR